MAGILRVRRVVEGKASVSNCPGRAGRQAERAVPCRAVSGSLANSASPSTTGGPAAVHPPPRPARCMSQSSCRVCDFRGNPDCQVPPAVEGASWTSECLRIAEGEHGNFWGGALNACGDCVLDNEGGRSAPIGSVPGPGFPCGGMGHVRCPMGRVPASQEASLSGWPGRCRTWKKGHSSACMQRSMR
jgi:hypothetical protein